MNTYNSSNTILERTVKPPLTLVHGPAGSGKTLWCLQRYIASGGKALLLVPTQAYAQHCKDKAARLQPDIPLSGIKTFGQFLRDVAGLPPSGIIHRTCQRLTLAGVVDEHVTGDQFFGRMRDTPGFAGALGDTIRELKLSRVSPESLDAVVESVSRELDDPDFARKAGEVAHLYASYQAFLKAHDLLDEEDLPSYAAVRIVSEETDWGLIPEILVDGFYRFSSVWRDVLAALATRGVPVSVTLSFDETRSLLFATPNRTLNAIEAEFNVSRIPVSYSGGNNSQLKHLEGGLFRPESVAWSESGSIRMFDAPNVYTEIEMVMRSLWREREMHNTPWNRCAIIVRSAAEYADLIRSIGESFNIPVAANPGRALADHPFVKTLLTLMTVFSSDWRRDDVIGFLKSSYVPVSKLAADSLRLKARRRGLREGRERWRSLVTEPELDNESLAATLAKMLEADQKLNSRLYTYDELAAEVEACIADLGILANDEEARPALSGFKETLEQVTVAARLSEKSRVSFADFQSVLVSALRSTSFTTPSKSDAVVVLEPYDSGQIDASVVAVMGLTERVFPRKINEDPFFRDEERDALRAIGEIDLENTSDRVDDERLLFYMAASAARERLILSFPRSSEESDTLPSFYLDEVKALFEHVPTEVRTLADVAPRPDECISERDRLLSQCAIQDDHLTKSAPSILASRHLPRLPELSESLRSQYGASRRYSITEIETYNRCPFQHFMKYGLEIRTLSDGAGAADKGTVLHNVMRDAFRKRRDGQAGMESAFASDDSLKKELTKELTSAIQDKHIDASPHRKRMMERALTDTLQEFAVREVRYAKLFGATPSFFELSFGQEPETGMDDEELSDHESRNYDPASTPKPLEIPGGEGQPAIQLCGAIDRVDLMSDEKRAIVLDYKLGNSVEWDRIKQGRSLQVPLYMMALEQLWDKVGAIACYESPRDKGRRRFIRRSEADIRVFQPVAGVEDGKIVKPLSSDEYMEAVTAAQASVRSAVAGIKSGYIMPTPGDYCRYCDYADVCRMGRDGVHDGQPYNASGPAVQ